MGYSACKRSIRRNATWSAIYISLMRNIPKFDTVLLHSNWSSLRRKYLSKIPTDVNALSCGPKTWKSSGISDAISSARHPQKSSQHVRACAVGDGAICSKNRIIVPYRGTTPVLEMARAYGLRPRLWLLELHDNKIVRLREFFEGLEISSATNILSNSVEDMTA